MTALEVLAKGGPMVWGVLLCSLLTVYALLLSLLVFRKTKLDTSQFILKVRSIYRDGDADSLITFCVQKMTPAARVVLQAMVKHPEGEMRMREATVRARGEEKTRLEGGVRLLQACGILAPLWGALSVCVSLFFSSLPSPAAGEFFQEAVSLPWVMLAPGLSLMVGMVAIAAYAYFSHAIRRIMLDIDRVVGDLFDLLAETPAMKTQQRADAEPVGESPVRVGTELASEPSS